MKEGLRRNNNTRRVLAEPIFSESGLEFSSTSYTGRPGKTVLKDGFLGAGRNIRVENSNHFMPPKKQVSATHLVDFYGRDYIVTPDVLIPRPETEMMVDAVLNLAGKAYLPGVKPVRRVFPEKFKVLDVGTGSGCVAISLALELPKASVTACDISDKALKVAKQNAESLGAKVDFVQSDLLDEVSGDFDVVVANLPYVDENWDWIDKKALAKEPSLALYAEDGGLALIKKLIKQVAERKVKYLILEADPCQHEQIVKYAANNNYSLLETRGFVLLLKKSS